MPYRFYKRKGKKCNRTSEEVISMKKFVDAKIELISFEMTDIITTSPIIDGPFDGEDDDLNN